MRNNLIDPKGGAPKLLLVGATLAAILAAPLAGSAAPLDMGYFGVKAENTQDAKIFATAGSGDVADSGGGTAPVTPVIPAPTPTPTAPVGITNDMTFTMNTAMPGCVAPQFSFIPSAEGATIDWGDGSPVTSLNSGAHQYANLGTYSVKIKGQVKSFGPMTSGSVNCFRTLDYFGENTGVTSTAGMFQGANNLSIVAAPPKSVVSYAGMFKDSRLSADISGWDTSNVRDMSSMFENSHFSGDISKWNTSNVTDMRSMFAATPSFNSAIGGWDMRRVARVDSMFAGASTFNQELAAWKLDSVTSFNSLFKGASSFSKDLPWDTSRVTSMNQTFSDANSFAGNISGWNTFKVTDFYRTFYKAYLFNGNLSGWDVSTGTEMTEMFSYTNSFNNGSLAGWKPSKVLHFDRMFELSVFNQNISGWPVDAAQSWGAFADRITDRTLIPYKFRF